MAPSVAANSDVDRPDVIALRRKLYGDRGGYRMIGSSVTDSGRLDEAPAGKYDVLNRFAVRAP